MFFSFFSHLLSYIFCLFGYVSNSNLYKEPLSKTEEEMYLRKYFNGDIEAKNILIEHNLRLVAHIAKKYAKNEQDLEEYISIGTIGLIKAINSFKENKGFKISTYASKCIENEILMNIRTSKKTNLEVSLNTVIGTDKDGNDMELADIIDEGSQNAIDTIYNKELVNQVKKFILNNLDNREKYIMCSRYGIGNYKYKTQQELADELKISRSYISRIETKVQNMIKEKIQK